MRPASASPLGRRIMEWHRREPVLSAWVALALAADLALIGLHLVAVVRGGDLPAMRLDVDRSYGELYEYLKVLWCLMLLALMALAARSARPLVWTPVLALMLVDNALQLHELVGIRILEFLGLAWDALPQVIAELAFVAVAYPLALVPVLLAWRSARGVERRLHRRMLLGLAAIFAVGVLFDGVQHVFIARIGPFAQESAALLEDGIELLGFSALLLVCAAGFLSAQRTSHPVAQR